MNVFTSLLFLPLMMAVCACALWDRRKRRGRAEPMPITVIVPCYNDAATVADSLRSIFAAWPRDLLQVITFNDASTDDSMERIREVARECPVEIIDRASNVGKAQALNLASERARYEWILCLDADTLLHRDAVEDMLGRLAHDPRVGGVSCPYSPVNRGFLPAMQAIEYSMLRLGQGAGNVTSTLALWGGCLMVRRRAFQSVGGFSVNAITEDVDLAFKLSRAGWRVEQSFVFIRTHVPCQWSGWLRQKVRWTAGGFQCFFRYPEVWLRNPLQTLFILAYAALTVVGLAGIATDNSLLNIGEDIAGMLGQMPLGRVWDAAWLAHGPAMLAGVASAIGFSLFSLVYVIPTISRANDLLRLLLVIPFSVGYYPLYLLASVLGFAFWFAALRRIDGTRRAW
jgi:poly-beta-1,6-N-acetyl-D-glucosamine synthase